MKINTIKNYMICLAIEMTRRCNLKCRFCAKGEPQDLVISKSIIDKTLDEMQGVFINTLRVSGGEPLLVPELIIYLFEKIREKHILINDIVIFTNGLCTDLQLCESICKIIRYQRQIEPEISDSKKLCSGFSEYVYGGLSKFKFSIIISDVGRNPLLFKDIENTRKFFDRNINSEDFRISKQSYTMKNLGCLALEGRAKDNINELLVNNVSLDEIRTINHNYYFLLEISANGNVFPGCLMSYDRVDKEPMFNIMDCKNDFFKRVNSFCWRYPVNNKVADLRSKYEALKFCKENNVKLKINEYDEINLNVLDYISCKCERTAKEIHSQYPELDFLIVEPLSELMVAKALLSNNIPIDQIKGYLGLFSELDMKIVNAISIDLCNQWIKKIKEHYHIK